MNEEISLAAPKLRRLIYGICCLHRETFFSNPLAYPSTTFERIPTPHYGTIQMQEELLRGPVRGQPVAEDGDEGRSAIPNPRFQRSSSTGNSFDPVKGKKFYELWGWPIKTSNPGTSFWQVPYSTNFFLLEDKIQDWCMLLFKLPIRRRWYGSKK